jgi:hypothetical protein
MTMTPADCCGRPPRTITIDLSEQGTLALLICDVCERQQWLKDGEPVDPETVKSVASTSFNRRAAR